MTLHPPPSIKHGLKCCKREENLSKAHTRHQLHRDSAQSAFVFSFIYLLPREHLPPGGQRDPRLLAAGSVVGLRALWVTVDSPPLLSCTPEDFVDLEDDCKRKIRHWNFCLSLGFISLCQGLWCFISSTRFGFRWRLDRMVSSDSLRLVFVILCYSSLTNGKTSFMFRHIKTRTGEFYAWKSFNILHYLNRSNEWLNACCFYIIHNQLSGALVIFIHILFYHCFWVTYFLLWRYKSMFWGIEKAPAVLILPTRGSVALLQLNDC